MVRHNATPMGPAVDQWRDSISADERTKLYVLSVLLSAIVLSILLRFTTSHYTFRIFKLCFIRL
jgi:hypothetical protein